MNSAASVRTAQQHVGEELLLPGGDAPFPGERRSSPAGRPASSARRARASAPTRRPPAGRAGRSAAPRGPRHSIHERAPARRFARVSPPRARLESRREVGDDVLEHGVEQRRLAGEVVVERPAGDAGGVEHGLDRGVLVAALAEQLARGRHQPLASRLAPRSASVGHPDCKPTDGLILCPAQRRAETRPEGAKRASRKAERGLDLLAGGGLAPGRGPRDAAAIPDPGVSRGDGHRADPHRHGLEPGGRRDPGAHYGAAGSFMALEQERRRRRADRRLRRSRGSCSPTCTSTMPAASRCCRAGPRGPPAQGVGGGRRTRRRPAQLLLPAGLRARRPPRRARRRRPRPARRRLDRASADPRPHARAPVGAAGREARARRRCDPLRATLDDLRFPSFADDFDAQARSAGRLRAMREEASP